MTVSPARWRTGLILVVVLVLSGCAFIENALGGGRLVDVGGREIFTECTGSGTPPVVLVPGSRGSHTSFDSLLTARGIKRSRSSVYGQVGAVTRVCTYDRPNTSPSDASMKSTPVNQPTDAAVAVADMNAWIAAEQVATPFVLVGYSYGGLVATLYAQTYPEQIAAIVYIDPVVPQYEQTLSPQQWRDFLINNQLEGQRQNSEIPNYPASIAEIKAAGPLPDVPIVLMSSDRPFDVGAGTDSFGEWLAAQDEFVAQTGAQHITRTDSSHLLPWEQPDLVSQTILAEVAKVRSTQPSPSASP